MTIDEKTAWIEEYVGPCGRLLAQSKSSYSNRHKNNVVFFNGNIFDSKGNKLWFGDVDTTKSKKELQRVAMELKESIYVTTESPFRWENQTRESLEEAAAETAYSRCLRIDP